MPSGRSGGSTGALRAKSRAAVTAAPIPTTAINFLMTPNDTPTRRYDPYPGLYDHVDVDWSPQNEHFDQMGWLLHLGRSDGELVVDEGLAETPRKRKRANALDPESVSFQ